MPNSIKKLSKPRKQVVTKVLRQEGFKLEEVGKKLGISEATVSRWQDVQTPEALKEFEEKFRVLVRGMQMEGTVMVLNRLQQLIPNERRISEVVRAGEFLSGGTKESSGVSFKDGDKEIKFTITRGED